MAVIQGELGKYNVFWGDRSGVGDATVFVYDGPVYRKVLFGLITIKNKEVWYSQGLYPRTYERVRKFTPAQLESWFKEVVGEYESHVSAWNRPDAQFTI